MENNNNLIGISGAGLPDYFNLAQFHFHWGSVNSVGSEDRINGHAYPMEVSGQYLKPFNAHCCHVNAAIKHPVPDRVKPSFVIFDIRALLRS